MYIGNWLLTPDNWLLTKITQAKSFLQLLENCMVVQGTFLLRARDCGLIQNNHSKNIYVKHLGLTKNCFVCQVIFHHSGWTCLKPTIFHKLRLLIRTGQSPWVLVLVRYVIFIFSPHVFVYNFLVFFLIQWKFFIK